MAGRHQGAFKQRGQDQHSKITLSIEEAFAGTQRRFNFKNRNWIPSTGQVMLKTRSS